MNKLRAIFKVSVIALVLGLLFPGMVFAADSNSLVGVDLTSPGKVVTYDIKINAENTIEDYNVSLSYETDVLELVGIENKNNWKGSNSITSATLRPTHNVATPLVFPGHPPKNLQDLITPSSTSKTISLEQVPLVLYLYSIKITSIKYNINSKKHILVW